MKSRDKVLIKFLNYLLQSLASPSLLWIMANSCDWGVSRGREQHDSIQDLKHWYDRYNVNSTQFVTMADGGWRLWSGGAVQTVKSCFNGCHHHIEMVSIESAGWVSDDGRGELGVNDVWWAYLWKVTETREGRQVCKDLALLLLLCLGDDTYG